MTPRFTFSGNIDNAMLWQWWAAAKLNHYVSVRNLPIRETLSPEYGVNVTITADRGVRKIHIHSACNIGIEHGVYDLAVATFEHDTYRAPPILDGGLLAYNGKSTTVIDRDISNRISCNNKQSSIFASNFFGGSTLTSDAKDLCHNLINVKSMMAAVKPSTFSGKMRLWIQAWYGAGAKDLTLFQVFGAKYALQYKTMFFDNASYLSTGLLTDEEGEFWLVSITSSAVFIDRVLLNECDSGIKKAWLAIKDSSQQKTEESLKIQALLLANARPAMNPLEIRNISTEIGGVNGSIPSYGFNFSWSGREASAVFIGSKDEDSTHRLVSTVVTITITPNGSGVFQSSVSVVEHGDWGIAPFNTLWTANHYVSIHEKVTPSGSLSTTGGDSSNSPFYVYYDENERILCSYSAFAKDAEGDATLDDSYRIGYGAVNCVSTAFTSASTYYAQVDVGGESTIVDASGEFFQTLRVNGEASGISIGPWRDQVYFGTGTYANDSPELHALYTRCVNDCGAQLKRYYYRTRSKVVYQIQADNTRQANGSVIAIIPFDDCEAVYTGSVVTDIITNLATKLTAYWPHEVQLACSANNTSNPCSPNTYWGINFAGFTFYTGYGSTTVVKLNHNASLANSGPTAISGTTFDSRLSVWLHCGGQKERVYTHTNGFDGSTSFGCGGITTVGNAPITIIDGWYLFFRPLLAETVSEYAMSCYSSVGGKRFAMRQPIEPDDGDWYLNDIGESPSYVPVFVGAY